MQNQDDNLLKFDIPEIIYGRGSLSKIGQCAARLGGEKVFVVTDSGIINAGWLDKTLEYLKQEGLRYIVYDNVVTNPRDFQAEHGVQLYLKKDCDVIIALGGGSPIDTAKGIAILATNHGSINEYSGCNLVLHPIPPLVCVPTTAGTGADISQFAVFLDIKKKMKMCILSRTIMPDISLIDPELLRSLSPELIAATGMDTLTHAIEAYVSSLSWPMTDPHAIHSIKLVAEHLVNAVKTKDITALEGMSIASLEAGMAFSNAILGAVHALSHPLGGLYDLHHGLVNSVILPAVLGQNLSHAIPKFAHISKALGLKSKGMSIEDAALHTPEKVKELIEALGLPTRLSKMGVDAGDIPIMAEMAKDDICMLTNPCSYSKENIEAMYREVW
ncbi:Iron-containing alcohol dehydrogenase [Desulfonema limicola]|uniref:Iron-containing alcohol dehydrogenase n=1 Tax=Desulfonema limicola TaxID=45656 RepID=A0A975BA23_9BACT|nr:iron-containing alcohol dehydrogenase [Desulfonema limicola]QTA81437.1 Iron-containing alcohol dehydrogenase [Desulfonema limicola]